MSLNTCAISGHLGKAAELRYTNSQLAVVTFSVAVNERARQADGSYQDVPHWFDCVMFGRTSGRRTGGSIRALKSSLTKWN